MHTTHILRRTATICALALVLAAGLAATAPAQTAVQFAEGTTSATLTGSVIRGETATYVVEAQAGQTLTVEITSLEANAVFFIQGPDGNTLAGADEGEDTMAYTGELVEAGAYTINVGPSRGNAEFTLTVELTD